MGKKLGVGKSTRKKKVPIQEEGTLMKNNPLIPPELDEDIDDDLAFDSDDERAYGSFFSAVGSRQKKGNNPAREEDNLYNYKEEGQFSGSDEEYMDLEDILDMNAKEEKRKDARKKKIVVDESGVKVIKKRRSLKDSLSSETLFPDHATRGNFASTLQKVIKASSSEGSAAASRIEQAFQNKHNLISVDVDDKTKDAVTRKAVREITEEKLKRYKPLLRELSSKHIRLPLTAPESNPVPSSVSAIASTSIGRLESHGSTEADSLGTSENKRVAQNLAKKMGNLMSKAGIFHPTSSPACTNFNGGESIFAVKEKPDFPAGQILSSSTSSKENLTPSAEEEAPSKHYMAKLKAMLATENSRRKRLNKIKSKTYRRILRKEKEHEKEKKEKAFELLYPELARKRLAEKLLKARAEERVTQKHKNTSAWVKHAKKFALFDPQKKDAINEQLSIHQRLMQKMDEEAGEEFHQEYAKADESSDLSDEEETMVDQLLAAQSKDDIKKVASNIMKSLEETEGGSFSGISPAVKKMRKDLHEMKFMKAARERAVNAYAEELSDLREDIENNFRPNKNGDVPMDAKKENLKMVGRIRFSTDGNTVENIALGGENSNVQKLESKTRELASRIVSTASEVRDGESESSEFAGCRATKISSSSSSRITVFPGTKQTEENSALAPSETHKKPNTSSRVQPNPQSTDDAESGLYENQTYLVSRAFVDDAIDDDFMREKEAQVEVMMKPEDRNNNLPGWGEWGGTDERLNKRHREKLAHAAMQRKIEKTFLLKSRADATLDHVILNHDGVELVPDRMKLHMIPRPFSNPQEFARSIRQPIGPEWISSLSFVEGVQPRVEVKQGQAVLPLDLSLRREKAQTKRRKMEIKN